MKITAIITTCLLGLIAGGCRSSKTTAGSTGESIMFIAHRGASYQAPGNTVVSAKRAWQLGADAVELDIHLSSDHRVMVHHDKTTSLESGGEYRISDTSSERLRQLDVGRHKGPEFAGVKIPFLEEVIATVPPGRKLFIEIKCGREVLPYLNDIIAKSGRRQQIIIIGFHLDTITAAKRLMPDIPVYWLVRGKKDPNNKKHILPLDLSVIDIARSHNLDGLDVHYASVTPTLINAARTAGMDIYAWTVDNPDWARQLAGWGVKGLTTDRPTWLKNQFRL